MLRRLLFPALVALASAAQAVAAGVDPEALRAPVHVLTSPAFEGRGTGTEGGERAARYVAAEFAAAGLEPLGTSRFDPSAALDGSGWFQPFTATVGEDFGPGNTLAATWGKTTVAYAVDRDFVPSTLSGGGSARGPVVFAGYGIVSRAAGRDDYGSRDVHGRIVLVLAGAPPAEKGSPLAEFAGIYHKVIFARDKGAAAVIVAAPEDSASPEWNAHREFTDEGLPVLFVAHRVAADWLRAGGWAERDVRRELAARPWPLDLPVEAALATDVRTRRRVTANVVGRLAGSDPALARETVVIGAHFDHLGFGGPSSHAASRLPALHPGADDNASGTAGLIALARAFAAAPRPRRSIVFLAFSGEELGLLGSAHWARHPLVPLADTVAMLNMDMIGRLREDRLAVIGTGTSPEWPALLREANRAGGFRLVFTDDPYGPSDQQSFYVDGIPVLFFCTGRHAEYHTPADTEATINFAGEARILGLVRDCAERIADGSARPAYREVDPPLGRSYRAVLGIVADPRSEETSGIPIARTTAGGPAFRAGVRPGDVIVTFAGHAMMSFHDLRIALSELAPGETIPLRVRRDGRLVDLTATLDAPAEATAGGSR